MELQTIVAAGAAGLGGILLVLLGFSRRARRRTRRRADTLEQQLRQAEERADRSGAGEREASWALSELSQAQSHVASDVEASTAELTAAEGRIDELSQSLSSSLSDLTSAQQNLDATRNELARLESELTRVSAQAVAAAEESAGHRDDAARLAEIEGQLEDERSSITELRERLASVPDPTDVAADHESFRDRFIASEAIRRDLEDQVLAIGAVRSAEQRANADRIENLERLHLEIGHREDRIEELSADLKQVTESRDSALEESARLEVEVMGLRAELATAEAGLAGRDELVAEVTTLKARLATLEDDLAQTAESAAEVVRLRGELDAERSRAERMARRAGEATTSASYAMWDRVVRERVDAALAKETTRLSEQIGHLREVVAEKESRIRALTGSSSPTDDEANIADLPPVTAIKGIGPVIAGILAGLGVESLRDIAALSDDDIDRIGAEMPVYPGRIRDDDWVGQAQSFL